MKAQWLKFSARIDALTVRERVMMFAAIAAGLVFFAHFFMLGPIFRQEERFKTRIAQQQNNIAGIDAEVAGAIQAYQRDPDQAARERLQQLRNEASVLGDSLRALQRGLVPPERMGPLVESILRTHGRLQLVSLMTLPSAPLLKAEPGAEPAPGASEPPAAGARGTGDPVELLYRHGVEVVVRGNYLDMIDYMAALESMPTGLFWGSAELAVENYPASRLTLTLYTLSLDAKWMKL